MVFLKRKRLIVWLFRAYLKKWSRTIVACFLVGLPLIALAYFSKDFVLARIPLNRTESIGIEGIYLRSDLPNNLPEVIQSQLSRGLTKVDDKGNVVADLADHWDIKDNGRTYVFYLKPNIKFADGSPLVSKSINYNFQDLTIERPAQQVIVFRLKEKYSPFLVTLADRKVFKKNNVGVSDYLITKIDADAYQVHSLSVYSKKDKKVIKYVFKDTQEEIKSAYVLGEVGKILDIGSLEYPKTSSLASFKNTNTSRNINPNKLVTVFFNTLDPVLSDKKVRKALAYSISDQFPEGVRAYTPYRKSYWFNNASVSYRQDISLAKDELSSSSSSQSGKMTISLKTLPQYRDLANLLAADWKKIGIETKIETVDTVPDVYQAFLGDLTLPKDPDQYTLWHSGAPSNITNYKNLRIDKLLEDGRTTYDKSQRKQIYDDFQKYLVDDMPAAFLYFPYTYTLTRN